MKSKIKTFFKWLWKHSVKIMLCVCVALLVVGGVVNKSDCQKASAETASVQFNTQNFRFLAPSGAVCSLQSNRPPLYQPFTIWQATPFVEAPSSYDDEYTCGAYFQRNNGFVSATYSGFSIGVYDRGVGLIEFEFNGYFYDVCLGSYKISDFESLNNDFLSVDEYRLPYDYPVELFGGDNYTISQHFPELRLTTSAYYEVNCHLLTVYKWADGREFYVALNVYDDDPNYIHNTYYTYSSGDIDSAYIDGYNNATEYFNNNVIKDSPSYRRGFSDGLNDDISKYGWQSFFVSVLQAPVTVGLSLLNFELFGFNLKPIILTLITLAIVFLILKLILGGGGN